MTNLGELSEDFWRDLPGIHVAPNLADLAHTVTEILDDGAEHYRLATEARATHTARFSRECAVAVLTAR